MARHHKHRPIIAMMVPTMTATQTPTNNGMLTGNKMMNNRRIQNGQHAGVMKAKKVLCIPQITTCVI